jgi:hypothetical protein
MSVEQVLSELPAILGKWLDEKTITEYQHQVFTCMFKKQPQFCFSFV